MWESLHIDADSPRISLRWLSEEELEALQAKCAGWSFHTGSEGGGPAPVGCGAHLKDQLRLLGCALVGVVVLFLVVGLLGTLGLLPFP